ncbi:MAG: fibronectin type III domain-containing protein [Verrucomicrobiales bacterium]
MKLLSSLLLTRMVLNLAICALCCISAAMAQTVLRGPYLQNGTPQGVSILWRTDSVTNGRVWIGTDPANLNQVIDEPTPVPAVVERGSVWRFKDDGSDQGSAWRGVAFDDGSWASGPAELGYGDTQTTLVNSGGSTKFITTYFRHTFNVADPSTISELNLGLQRDDGAIVYLNGTEIRRDRMTDPVTFSKPADSPAVGGAEESIFYVTSLSSSQIALLVPGNNILAVEIHQQATTSSDISFDLELYEPQQGGGGNGLDHLVRISGLQADTTYYYQVGTDTNVILAGGDANHFFKTSPEEGSTEPVRVWVLGDSGTADNNARLVRDAYLGTRKEINTPKVVALLVLFFKLS